MNVSQNIIFIQLNFVVHKALHGTYSEGSNDKIHGKKSPLSALRASNRNCRHAIHLELKIDDSHVKLTIGAEDHSIF